MPNLFVLGAPKCGTTSLYRYLAAHPEIYFPFNKEPQFFCLDELYAKGLDYYLDTFFAQAAGTRWRAEATPHYLGQAAVAARIARAVNNAESKFLVILREPVARAYSHYWNMVKEGYEGESFAAALAAETARVSRRGPGTLEFLRANYVGAGLYAQQLSAYFNYFERAQFHILFQEDLHTTLDSTLASVWRFLEIPPLAHVKLKPSNPASKVRSVALQRFIRRPNRIRRLLGGWLSPRAKHQVAQWLLRLNSRVDAYPPMQAEIAAGLRATFASDIRALERMLGRDLSSWLGDTAAGVDPSKGEH